MTFIKEKILKSFEKYPELKVLFFFDPEGEFLEEVSELHFDDIRIVKYQNNDFQLKLSLNSEWSEEKVFLYLPIKFPETQSEYHSFPLLDLLVANRALLLDEVSGLLEDLGWRTQHKHLAAKFSKELKYGYIQEIIKSSLTVSEIDENSLTKVLICGWLGAKEIKNDYWIPGKILTVSVPPANEDFKKFSSKVVKYNLESFILGIFEKISGVRPGELSYTELQSFINILKYNCITLEIAGTDRNDPYKELKIKDYVRLQKLNSFRLAVVSDKELGLYFNQTIELSGHLVHESEILKVYGIDKHFPYKTENLIKGILTSCSLNLGDNPEKVNDLLMSLLSEIDLSSISSKYCRLFIHITGLSLQVKKIGTYILNSPTDYIYNYVGTWHRIDMDYRKAILLVRDLQLHDGIQGINLDKIKSGINKIYNDFLKNLNREWLKCLSQVDSKKLIAELSWQYKFFEKELKNREVKTVVIISDGFRFEAGSELLGVLHKDPKNIAELRYATTSLPSVTAVGMSNLLPAKDRVWNEKGILLDKENVDLIQTREASLNKYDSDSRAINYTDIKDLSHEEKRKLFTSGLVYIYQNIIDAIGDKRTTETEVFGEVEKAIKELASFIKQLHTSYNVTRVIVTADHGFLYTDEMLEEVDKETIDSKEIVDKSTRYAVVKSKINNKHGYSFPMKLFSGFDNNFYVIIPEAVNRYKHPGSGLRYVHGGASLQEMIIPVLDSRMKRKEIGLKVSPVIVDKELKVVSNICKFTISQDKPVSEKEKERVVIIGLYDENEPISELQSIVMNKVSGRPSERVFNIQLNLTAGSSFSPLLKLKIFDSEDLLNTLIEMNVVNKSMITPDFE